MLTYMFENKRILNLREQKFAKLIVFQANTTVFQDLETQVGQLALSM